MMLEQQSDWFCQGLYHNLHNVSRYFMLQHLYISNTEKSYGTYALESRYLHKIATPDRCNNLTMSLLPTLPGCD